MDQRKVRGTRAYYVLLEQELDQLRVTYRIACDPVVSVTQWSAFTPSQSLVQASKKARHSHLACLNISQHLLCQAVPLYDIRPQSYTNAQTSMKPLVAVKRLMANPAVVCSYIDQRAQGRFLTHIDLTLLSCIMSPAITDEHVRDG